MDVNETGESYTILFLCVILESVRKYIRCGSGSGNEGGKLIVSGRVNIERRNEGGPECDDY